MSILGEPARPQLLRFCVRRSFLIRIYHHLVLYWKIHRTRQTADLVRAIVNRYRLRNPARIGDLHPRPQDHARELPRAIGMLHYLAHRIVGVCHDHDARIRAKMQYPEHVAR